MDGGPTLRIAMWSGPRNLSTAMMRSFGARPDCGVVDEPFFAAYLHATGIDHPLRDETVAQGPADYAEARALCLGPAPQNQPIFYQKHMTHHMIDGFDTGWMAKATNVFMIRHPARVVASYARKRENPSIDDLGYARQAELFDHVGRLIGAPPAVFDSDDLLVDPAAMLQRLCPAIGIIFLPAMLSWQAGPHPEDGAWAPHWYQSVWDSTGFSPPPAQNIDQVMANLDDAGRDLVREALPLYDALAAHRIQPRLDE